MAIIVVKWLESPIMRQVSVSSNPGRVMPYNYVAVNDKRKTNKTVTSMLSYAFGINIDTVFNILIAPFFFNTVNQFYALQTAL